MKRKQRFFNRLMKRRLSGWWLSAAFALLAPLAQAQSAFGPSDSSGNFDPNAVYTYTCPPQNPTVDATNFVIYNSFSINFNSESLNAELYEPYDTINYTNNGLMMANTGFKFDTQPSTGGADAMAGVFYNAGTVSCGSISNTTALFFASAGQSVVWATNMINSGTVDVGEDGLISFSGQNADFTGGNLNIEGLLNNSLFSTVNFSSVGAVGTDTNDEWNPGTDLGSGTALSSFSPFPTQLYLTNSTSYFSVVEPSPNYIVYRAVFVQNTSAQAPYKVYIDAPNAASLGFESGAAHVEWDGYYLDPATGQYVTNYLYFTDDYAYGASTNAAVVGGVPNSFSFITSPTPLLAGPITAGFDNVFPNVNVTNPFAYMSGKLLGTTVTTNITPQNPYGVLTNLYGRIQITASNELNLTQTTISGPNYLALTAPHQFDGSPGASISAPYSDINLGVTNGILTITNLLIANIPQWSGTLQAWSTRFVAVDTTLGVTNDYRILLVNSQLQPTTQPCVQTLRLHATNSLQICDALNVFGSVYIDAKSLTLATNLIGNGATSVDGELNWNNTATFGAAQLPNLLWLTNDGAMRMQGNAIFGSSTVPYGAFVNNSLVSDVGTIIDTTNFVNAGTITNGVGIFTLQAQAALLTNGLTAAGSDMNLAAGTLVVSNETLQAGRMLQLAVTNLLTDEGTTTNGNFWSVGANGISGVDGGFDLVVKPSQGDLLWTTVTNISPPGKKINNVWAGLNQGVSNSGYTNNVAVGHLILNAMTNTSSFYYTGTGTNNAIYVDCLEFDGYATNGVYNSYDFTPWLAINTNLVIYYAQALVNGFSVAEEINDASVFFGKNNGRLLWVPSYAGHFSSTNMVYPNGTTNTVNMALAQSTDIDSSGSGTANAYSTAPIFTSSQLNFASALTNVPPLEVALTWSSIPSATNYIYYTTNLVSTNWMVLTNFVSPSQVPPAGGWPITNIYYDKVSGPSRYYQINVAPNAADEYGPGF